MEANPVDSIEKVIFRDTITARMLRTLLDRKEMTQAEFMRLYMERCARPPQQCYLCGGTGRFDTRRASGLSGKPDQPCPKCEGKGMYETGTSSFQNNFGRFVGDIAWGQRGGYRGYGFESRYQKPLAVIRQSSDKMHSVRNLLTWIGPSADELIASLGPQKLQAAYESLERQLITSKDADDERLNAWWVQRLGEEVGARPRANPASRTALRMYEGFHQHEPKKLVEFHKSFTIPQDVVCIGTAKNVLYRSDKLNPETGEDEGWIDYIHDHGSGVLVYVPQEAAENDGDLVRVPSWIRGVDELVWLGDCLGFEYKDQTGKGREATGTKPLPELYTIPSGRALLVIQGKRELLALIWGGRLGVEPRGIVH